VLPSILPGGARTFLPFPLDARRGSHPVYLAILNNTLLQIQKGNK